MSQDTRTQLQTLKDSLIVSGNRSTTAADLRQVLDAMITSMMNIIDDLNTNGGYLQVDNSGRVDISKISASSPNGLFLQDNGQWASTPNFIVPQYFSNQGPTGNSGTSETDLSRNPIVANTLTNDGDTLECIYGGVLSTSATANRRIRLYFGGQTLFDSSALSIGTATPWFMKASLTRFSATELNCVVSFFIQRSSGQTNFISVPFISPLNFGTSNDLLITGQATGTGVAANDITLTFFKIDKIKAPI